MKKVKKKVKLKKPIQCSVTYSHLYNIYDLKELSKSYKMIHNSYEREKNSWKYQAQNMPNDQTKIKYNSEEIIQNVNQQFLHEYDNSRT